MYTPISCEFFDQLNVAMKRNIPSTIVYLQNDEKKTIKGLIETMSVIDGFEYLILTELFALIFDLFDFFLN